MKEMESAQVMKTDLDHVWHPLTQHKVLEQQPPTLVVGAEGSTIRDAEGHEYLDAMAGLWCVNVGYGRKAIADAVYAQMLELPYFPHTMANQPAAILAETVAALSDGELPHTYYVNSGTEANEAALKMARQYQRQVKPTEQRYKFVSRHYSYHGTSLATLAAGGVTERRALYGPMDGSFLHIPPAYCYRCPFGKSPDSCGLECAKHLEYTIEAEGAQTVAAVVMEPIQSGIGVLVPPDGYLPEIARICKQHGVLLILDEVINGFGRTGKWFAHQHYGVTPDLLCVAKGLTSGYQPMGAVMSTSEVFNAFLGEPGDNRHNQQVNTWGGHAAACAGAIANLRIMADEDLPNRAAEMGAYLLDGLRTLLALPIVGDVRGKGLLAGVELVADKATKAPLAKEQVAWVMRQCWERGVIFGRSVVTANTITIAPPLVLKRAEADRIVETLAEVLSLC